ncbi:hypothetical protein QEN19_004321 [Hanseniaspora menglaensis]
MNNSNNNNNNNTNNSGNSGRYSTGNHHRYNNNNNNSSSSNNNNRYNNNRYQNNKYNNKYNNRYNNQHHHQTQVQPLKIAKEQILELNNYVNDIIEVYIGKNLKVKGKLLSYDLENLDMILDQSFLYVLKDLTLLSEEEEMQVVQEAKNKENLIEEIYDDKIEYGITMVKGNMIISFNKAM